MYLDWIMKLVLDLLKFSSYFLLNTLELDHSELLFDRLRTLRHDALHKDSGMTHVRLLFVAEKKTEKEKKLPM